MNDAKSVKDVSKLVKILEGNKANWGDVYLLLMTLLLLCDLCQWLLLEKYTKSSFFFIGNASDVLPIF